MYNTSLNIKILIIAGVWIFFQNYFIIKPSKVLKTGKEINPVIINIKKAIQNPGTVSLSEIADSIQYIILKEKPGNYINGKIAVKLSKNYLFVLDLDGIKQFSLDGTFIRKIGKKGKGPQEYLHISDFAIDEINYLIYILSVQTKQILIYNFNGIFINSIRGIDDSIDGINILKNNKLLFHKNNPYGTNEFNYFITNGDYKIIKKLNNNIKFKSTKLDFMGRYLRYYTFNNLVNFKDVNDTLFVFEPLKDEFISKAVFVCDHYINKDFKGYTMANLNEISKIPYYYNIWETKSFIFFSFGMNGKKYYCYYDLNKKMEYCLDNKKLIANNVDYLNDFWPEFQNNNQIMMLIQCDNFHEGLPVNTTLLNSRSKKIMEEIPAEGWVVMIVKLKK